jgi:hypothetical protein
VDYGVRAVDVRIRGQQPSRSIRLNENARFYEGFQRLVLAWVSCGATSILRSLPLDGVAQHLRIGTLMSGKRLIRILLNR